PSARRAGRARSGRGADDARSRAIPRAEVPRRDRLARGRARGGHGLRLAARARSGGGRHRGDEPPARLLAPRSSHDCHRQRQHQLARLQDARRALRRLSSTGPRTEIRRAGRRALSVAAARVLDRGTQVTYDVIVIGVGGMGSAAAYHLAMRGATVLALEQFDIPHDLGSSHGLSRIIRLAYWEHPDYVPLVRRAYVLWRELERAAGESLLVVSGSIDAGPPDSVNVTGARAACATFGIECDELGAAALTSRFPGYRLPADAVAIFQRDGGFLRPEACVTAHVA